MELVKYLPLYLHGRPKPVQEYNFLGRVFPSNLTFTRASTGTYFDPAGVLKTATVNEPRFDYDPVTLVPRGLLMEESRSNVCLYSGQVGTSWPAEQVVVTTSPVQAPIDGTVFFRRVADTSVSAQHFYSAPHISYTAGNLVTFSCFAKIGTARYMQITVPAAAFSAAIYANFDLQTGVVSQSANCTAIITPVGNGVYRCSVTATVVTTTTGTAFVIAVIPNGTATRLPSYTGVGDYFEVVAFQTEVGAFPTSYISTTSAAVTRAVDACYTASIPWFNLDQGAALIDAEARGISTSNAMHNMVFSNGTTANAIYGYAASSSGDAASGVILSSTVYGSGGAFASYAVGTPSKLALSYKSGANLSAFKGGMNNAGGFGTASLPSVINRLDLMNRISGDRPFNGWIRSFRYWPRALSSTELQRITT